MAFQPYNLPDDPFKRLKDQLRRRLQEEMVDDKIFALVKETYTTVIQSENIVLSRAEQNRLLQAVLKETLNDMLAKL
jgi:hypothetical protein